jgi:uncharacterized membrane protein (DUF2068 family)
VYYAVVGVGIAAIAVLAVYGFGVIPVALRAFQSNPEVLVGIALVVGGIHLTAAYGLWGLRGWSRLLVVALSLAGVVFGIFTIPLGFASVMLNIVTFWYMTHHRVREVFATASRPPA